MPKNALNIFSIVEQNEPAISETQPAEAGFDPKHQYEILRKSYRMDLNDVRETKVQHVENKSHSDLEYLIHFFTQFLRKQQV